MNAIQSQLDLQPKVSTKTCRKCGRDLPLSCFRIRGEGDKPKRINIDCKQCVLEDDRLRNNLRKTAPPVPLVCDLCEESPSEPYRSQHKKLCLDHDHKTKTFRGWLCDSCNVGLSRFRDDPVLLEKAIKYLKKHEKP